MSVMRMAYVCVRAGVCVRTHLGEHVCPRVRARNSTYTCVCVSMSVPMHMCVCECVAVCVRTITCSITRSISTRISHVQFICIRMQVSSAGIEYYEGNWTKRSDAVFPGSVLLTVGWSYVGNDVTPSTLLDRACSACSYENLPKYLSYHVSNTAPSTSVRRIHNTSLYTFWRQPFPRNHF